MNNISTFKVYVKPDENNIITAINSSAFLNDTTGWVEIDEGLGDKYRHAQNYYFPHPISDDDGIYNFKLINGKPEFRTDEDKSAERKKLLADQEIAELKHKLSETDYISAKISEGAATVEEYSDKIAQRAAWRLQINELESYI